MKIPDSKIIKGLECCLNQDCKNCPCLTEDVHCLEVNEALIVFFFNRQKAETIRLIKRLEARHEKSALIRERNVDLSEMKLNLFYELRVAKAEAIREFAERLKKLILPQLGISTLEKTEAYHFCLVELDNLVKEMTEVLDECN